MQAAEDVLRRHRALALLTYSFPVAHCLAAAPAALGPPSAAAPPDRAPPRRPGLPAVHRQILVWLLQDLVRWFVASDQVGTFRSRKGRRRCIDEVHRNHRSPSQPLRGGATRLRPAAPAPTQARPRRQNP
jgi:hypothetical protein